MVSNLLKSGKYQFYVTDVRMTDKDGNKLGAGKGKEYVKVKLSVIDAEGGIISIYDSIFDDSQAEKLAGSLDEQIGSVNKSNLDRLVGMGGSCLISIKPADAKYNKDQNIVQCYLKNFKQGRDMSPIVDQFKALGATVNPTDGIPF